MIGLLEKYQYHYSVKLTLDNRDRHIGFSNGKLYNPVRETYLKSSTAYKPHEGRLTDYSKRGQTLHAALLQILSYRIYAALKFFDFNQIACLHYLQYSAYCSWALCYNILHVDFCGQHFSLAPNVFIEILAGRTHFITLSQRRMIQKGTASQLQINSTAEYNENK